MHSGQLCSSVSCSRGVCHFCLGKFREHLERDGIVSGGDFSMQELDEEGTAYWDLVGKVSSVLLFFPSVDWC
jgi:hypothetical protein